MKIAIAGIGYVGLPNAIILSQHNKVYAVDLVQSKLDLINNKKSQIVDKEIEDYLANKSIDLDAVLDEDKAYIEYDPVIVTTPTNYDLKTNKFDVSFDDVGDKIFTRDILQRGKYVISFNF